MKANNPQYLNQKNDYWNFFLIQKNGFRLKAVLHLHLIFIVLLGKCKYEENIKFYSVWF